jgi:L-lactate dehydrogenase complex protein LldG
MDRETFLGRLPRKAAAAAPAALPATMVSGDPDTDPWERFASQLALVGGEARRVVESEIGPAVAEALSGCSTAVVSADLGEHAAAVRLGLERAGCQVLDEGRADAASAEAGVTGAVLGVASTGSVLLSSAAGSRTTSLLPPVHLVVLPEERLVAGFEELFEHLPELGAASQLVLITGPSRTADIEMTLVRSVHGPGRLVAIVVGR